MIGTSVSSNVHNSNWFVLDLFLGVWMKARLRFLIYLPCSALLLRDACHASHAVPFGIGCSSLASVSWLSASGLLICSAHSLPSGMDVFPKFELALCPALPWRPSFDLERNVDAAS